MNIPRLGLIGQPHRTGIGNQTWDFARFMEPTKVLVTDLTRIHAQYGKPVSRTKWFESWEHRYCAIPKDDDLEWLLDGIDVLFVVETPLNWDVFRLAQEKGVATILQYNAEFLEYFRTPDLPRPDCLLAPSPWMVPTVELLGIADVVYLPVPIATDRFHPRDVDEAKLFIHVAGHKTHADRNGTEVVMEALAHIKTQAEVRIYSQNGANVGWKEGKSFHIPPGELDNYWDLYAEGDVLLIPRRYGGLSLQIQEACAAGMIPVFGHHDPYADEGIGVKVHSIPGDRLKLRTMVNTFNVPPQSLARQIDALYQRESIIDLSDRSVEYASKNSWEALRPRYRKLLKDVCG